MSERPSLPLLSTALATVGLLLACGGSGGTAGSADPMEIADAVMLCELQDCSPPDCDPISYIEALKVAVVSEEGKRVLAAQTDPSVDGFGALADFVGRTKAYDASPACSMVWTLYNEP